MARDKNYNDGLKIYPNILKNIRIGPIFLFHLASQKPGLTLDLLLTKKSKMII